MCRKFYTAFFLTLCLALFWHSETSAQSFPYHLSVESIPGQCYDDARLIFTLTDDNGNVVQIDPQTHNAVNTAPYPLLNVQYHYQNAASGLEVQYNYDNEVMLTAGSYNVGVRGYIPMPDGTNALVDTTIYNVQVTTSYQSLAVSVLTNLAIDNIDGQERFGYHPSFQCADLGRIQLHIVQGSFPYEVTILDEHQDTVRHTLFYHRVNSGTFNLNANYRDYYTFDSIPIGTYTIYVSDSCGYVSPQMSITIPDAEPTRYLSLVQATSHCPEDGKVPFVIERRGNAEYGGTWRDYMYPYLDSILLYRFINPGYDTTGWMHLESTNMGYWNYLYDTLPNYCVMFNDTIRMQMLDLCHDTLLTYTFRFVPQFSLHDTSLIVYLGDSLVFDTCANYLQSGVSTQSYRIEGDTWKYANSTLYGGSGYASMCPIRYYKCPITYNVWSMPDSTLLAHSQSDEFTWLGDWVTFGIDTSVSVHVSITDAQGCLLAEKDTVFVYDANPLDSLLFWFECHSDKDDGVKDHCCADRYLWIQEHGVDANTFRRNMTLRLMDSPLYDQFNFTAVRQDGMWNITFDDTSNHSTYIEFSYEDGWRATLRDSVCLPPGRYVFEVTTDCGVDTITYSRAGYYYDTIAFTSLPQYEFHQICDRVQVTQSIGLLSYIYFVDPDISNDVPIQEECDHDWDCYSYSGISSTENSQGLRVLEFSVPGDYYIHTYCRNHTGGHNVASYSCIPMIEHEDIITISFSYLDYDMAAALLCDSSSSSGIVYVKAVNGNAPYNYTLYDQPGATGNVLATSTSGYFDNVPMTEGQQYSVQVKDSCQASFYVNMTAALLTNGNLLWEQDATVGVPHDVGDTVHLNVLNFPPPVTYQWTGPNGFTSTSQAVDIVLPDTSYSGWYYLQILNSFCGSVIADSVYINVVSPPQVIVLYDTVCQWAGYEDNGFSLSVAETSVPGDHVFTILQQTGYYADTIVLHLTVNPSVTVVVEVTALGSYTWHGATYTSSGSYSRSADGCSGEILLLTITDTLGVTVVTDDDSLCRGESTTLHAQASNAYVLPPVAVGDILCTDGDIVKPSSWPVAGKMAQGVVFYVDTSGAHGWAVHLNDQSEQVKWSSILVDVPGVSNYLHFHADDLFPDYAGYANTQALWVAGDSLTYPAAHTVDFPHGWYLPDVGQLDVLFSEMTVLNPSLQIVGGTPFPTDEVWFYWSSTESAANNPNFAWFVCSNGLVDYWAKSSSYYNYHGLHYEDMVEGHLRVRSIRDF